MLNKLRLFFQAKKTDASHICPEKDYKSPEEIIANSDSFYDKEDLVFFPGLNAYGAFKYNVVKDILSNNKAITVSNIHIELNSVYFSINEQKHQNNKKAAYQHLEFLSKKLQNEPNEYTEQLFHRLKSMFPVEKEFDLTEYLINPLIFISILKEYGFIDYMPRFSPWHDEYNHENAIELINSYFNDSSLLTTLIIDYFKDGNPIPDKMQHFLSDIQSDHKINDELLAQFFASMIFSGTHSTASFLSSYIYTIFSQFSHFWKDSLHPKNLEILEDEILRLHMPVQWIFRTVREDTQYAGINLKTGDTVLLFVGIANTDPTIFEDPHQIKFDRKVNHLSFGTGPYACIGKFTTHRMAVNLVSYLSQCSDEITLTQKEVKHTIHNAILKTPVLVTYHSLS